MKKILLVLSLVMASMVNVNAQGTYRGFFDVGFKGQNEGPYLEVVTTHGYQFNKNWFLGAGFGVMGADEAYVPLFVKFRYDRLSEKSLTFFTEVDLGCIIDYEEWVGPHVSTLVGMRRILTNKIGLNFGVGVGSAPYDDDIILTFNVKVGIDFLI